MAYATLTRSAALLTAVVEVPMASITLPALPLSQGGHQLIQTKIRAADLPKFVRVDVYDPSKPVDSPDQGYQRAAEMPRVKKFANWLRRGLEDDDGVLVPTSILLSSRKTPIEFDPKSCRITLNSERKLHLVDGQHRARGFEYAVFEKLMTELGDFEIPVIIVVGLDRVQEMRQFAVVNGTQKSVRTDLVNMILTQLASRRGEGAIEDREHWKVVVSRVVESLNVDPTSPWHGMILMPNESTRRADRELDDSRKLVRATSFMTSLKQIYDHLAFGQFFEGLSLVERADRLGQVVKAFWQAVGELNPEAFASPETHVLQKTPGLFALHKICVRILPGMHMARRRWDKENFRVMLEPCDALRDPQYWEAADGGAAKYGSMKGFSELSQLLWEDLEDGLKSEVSA